MATPTPDQSTIPGLLAPRPGPTTVAEWRAQQTDLIICPAWKVTMRLSTCKQRQGSYMHVDLDRGKILRWKPKFAKCADIEGKGIPCEHYVGMELSTDRKTRQSQALRGTTGQRATTDDAVSKTKTVSVRDLAIERGAEREAEKRADEQAKKKRMNLNKPDRHVLLTSNIIIKKTEQEITTMAENEQINSEQFGTPDTPGTPQPTRVHVTDIEVLGPDEHDYKSAGRFPALQSRVIEELSSAFSRASKASDRVIEAAKKRAELMESWAAQTEEQFDEIEMFRRKQGN